jgi:hypothetical protein
VKKRGERVRIGVGLVRLRVIREAREIQSHTVRNIGIQNP